MVTPANMQYAEARGSARERDMEKAPQLPAAPANFDELYLRHVDFVARSLSRLGVRPSQIDDAAQDVFVVMHRRISDLRADASTKAFCLAVAVRVARGYRRTAWRKAAVNADMSRMADLGQSPFDQAARAQAERVLEGFLGGLDSDRRTVFMMAELEEMTAPEISQELHMNLSTVYTRLRAARQRFVAYLNEREELPAPRWRDQLRSRADGSRRS